MTNSPRHLLITFILSTLVLVSIVSINMRFESKIYLVTGEGSFLSDLGIILWCVSATVCFFATVLLNNNRQQKACQFLLYSALLTAYLLFDDFFELHERLSKLLDISEKTIYIILGIATAILVIRFRQIILQTNYIVMLMALSFLTISVAADGILNPMEIVYGTLVMVVASSFYLVVFHPYIFKEYLLVVFIIIVGLYAAFAVLQTKAEYSEYIFEEGAKWLGIASWCSYYTYAAYELVINSYKNGATNYPAI